MSAKYVDWIAKRRKAHLVDVEAVFAGKIHKEQLMAWVISAAVGLRRKYSGAAVALPLQIKEQILEFIGKESKDSLGLYQNLAASSIRHRTDAAKALIKKELDLVIVPKVIARLLKGPIEAAADKGYSSTTVNISAHDLISMQQEVTVLNKKQGGMLMAALQAQGFTVMTEDIVKTGGSGRNAYTYKDGLQYKVSW
eukprot:TRINITY_DN42954_c0_g1_i1.p1 TRINITY_DN42954_c0_g1~~TRINITY_DN42954_c0_g1_i1.p1  ORF type:complete len:196 (-),score=35.20 TRINITY_DN42954_c0_g1_i1:140-727(-)